jgi:hypothetical protein
MSALMMAVRRAPPRGALWQAGLSLALTFQLPPTMGRRGMFDFGGLIPADSARRKAGREVAISECRHSGRGVWTGGGAADGLPRRWRAHALHLGERCEGDQR